MNANEKKISFLNRYVVYKKIRIVNAAKVILEEAEQVEVPKVEEVIELDIPVAVTEKKKRTRKVNATTGEASKTKPKGARKLATKLVIVEDVDTSASSNGSNPNPKTTTTQKKKLVLQDGSDSD